MDQGWEEVGLIRKQGDEVLVGPVFGSLGESTM